MDESLLSSKGIQPTKSCPGYLEGFRLHIGERATLLPEQDGQAYGLLMQLPENKVTALYSDQSVRDYVAEPVVVRLADDTQVAGVCYNLPTSMLKGANPKYAAALLELATSLDFPEHYLAHIREATEPS